MSWLRLCTIAVALSLLGLAVWSVQFRGRLIDGLDPVFNAALISSLLVVPNRWRRTLSGLLLLYACPAAGFGLLSVLLSQTGTIFRQSMLFNGGIEFLASGASALVALATFREASRQSSERSCR